MQQILKDNWALFRDINGQAGHQPPLDALMIFSADRLIFLVPVLLLILWFAFAHWSPYTGWMTRRIGPEAAEHERRLGQSFALSGCLAVGFALLLNTLLGSLLFEPRPFVSHPAVTHELVPHVGDASFPSDHEAVTAAVASVLIIFVIWLLVLFMRDLGTRYIPARRIFAARLTLPLILAIIALVCLFVIGFARVYVGVHYPGDIAGGMATGTVGGALAVALRPAANVVYRPLVRVAEVLRLA